MSLVGLSGTGKSSVAPLLAERTGRRCVDLDGEIERTAGRAVPEIFSTDGEEGFRVRELAALRAVLDGPPTVVATGGGVVTTPDAVELLRGRTTVVWLEAPPEVLAERLAESAEPRPLLEDNARARLRRMQAERGPLYASAADMSVDVTGATASEVAERIALGLRERRDGERTEAGPP